MGEGGHAEKGAASNEDASLRSLGTPGGLIVTEILKYLWERRTTVLGYIQIVLGVIVTSQGMFSDDTLRWFVLANGIVTAVLGHYNNSKIKALQNQIAEKEEQ